MVTYGQYPQAYMSKEWDQNINENKFQVMYVNAKYDQYERASDFLSALLCDE
jgi:hypothetical protein